jgi:hypothetical protein
MEFSDPAASRSAVETVTVSVQIFGAEPRSRHGSKALYRPEWIRVTWTRHSNAGTGWDEWSANARVVGSWLRNDGSRANRDPVSDTLYRDRYADDADDRARWLAEVEKTRPQHAAPALAALEIEGTF